jgi:hypothetical protein
MKRFFVIAGFVLAIYMGLLMILPSTSQAKTSIVIPVIAIVVIFLIFRYLKNRQEDPDKSSNTADMAMLNDEMSWATRATNEIAALDKKDLYYEDKKWFFEQVFLFYSDRTMHHPNPGITLGEIYDWKLPEKIDHSKFIYEHKAQEQNPYMHPWLLKSEIMGKLGDEHSKTLHEEINNAAEEYKRGEISFLDYYFVRESVYRQIPEWTHLYEDAKVGDIAKAFGHYGLSKLLRREIQWSPYKTVEPDDE